MFGGRLRTIRFGWGAAAAAPDLQAIPATAMAGCGCTCLPMLWMARERSASSPHRRALGGKDKSAKPPVCWSAPTASRPRLVRGRGWGGAWAGPPPTFQVERVGKFLPWLRGLRRLGRLRWPQAACRT